MKNSFLLISLILFSCANPNFAPEPGALDGADQGSELRCHAQFESGSCVSFGWDKMPTEEEFGSFQFKTFRIDPGTGTKTIEDIADLGVLLWMPGMGHGSSPITLERVRAGTYRATKVYFTMHGEWDIRFQVKVGQELRDQAILRVQF